MSGPCESPVLGRKGRPPPLEPHPPQGMVKSAFESEDSDLLVYNPPPHLNPNPHTSSRDIQEDNASAYSWSESHCSIQGKGTSSVHRPTAGNLFEKRPRRKMVKDPVTGLINQNPKQQRIKPVKKRARVSHQQTYVDLRPLEQFQSRLITRNRITVSYPRKD